MSSEEYSEKVEIKLQDNNSNKEECDELADQFKEIVQNTIYPLLGEKDVCIFSKSHSDTNICKLSMKAKVYK